MSYSDPPEQPAVIARRDRCLVVSVFAGTEKTSSLRCYAEENLTERMLYIVYSGVYQFL